MAMRPPAPGVFLAISFGMHVLVIAGCSMSRWTSAELPPDIHA
jgi:hypothetical protein